MGEENLSMVSTFALEAGIFVICLLVTYVLSETESFFIEFNWHLQLMWITWFIVWVPRWFNMILGLFGRQQLDRPATEETVTKQNLVERLFHLTGIIVAMIVLTPAHSRFSPPHISWLLFGYCVFIFGVVFVIYARIYLAEFWRGTPAVRKDHKLITTGPYAVVRHPIYTGIYLMGLGCVIASQFYWVSGVGLGVLVCLYIRKLTVEEAMLSTHFGSEYSSYC